MINILLRMKNTLIILCAVVLGVAIGAAVTQRMIRPMQVNGTPIGRFEQQYPGFFQGPMVNAQLGDLPDGTLVNTGQFTVSMADIEKLLRSEAPAIARRIKINMQSVVEQMAQSLLIKQEIWEYARKQNIPTNTPEKNISDAYQADLVRTTVVNDSDIEAFYKQQTKQYGDSMPPLDVIRDQIKQSLIQTAMKHKFTVRINLQAQKSIVNRKWVEAQYKELLLRPDVQAVEKLRFDGKPLVLVFAMDEPKMMSAVNQQMNELKKSIGNKAHVGVVPISSPTFLTARYRVRSFWVTIVFNAAGREVYRTEGQVPTEELLLILKQAGM
ncbi:MAG: hypothetical protein ACYC1M_13425 [Armatimonadota bacterium]